MARTKMLNIRLSDREYAIFEAMAEAEHLPIGTYVRRLLLLEAEKQYAMPLTITEQLKTNA